MKAFSFQRGKWMGNELTTKLKRTVLIQMFNSIHHKNFIFRKRYKAYIKWYHLISFGCKDESEKQSEINIPWRHILHIFFLIFHETIASSLSIYSSTIPNHACREHCRYSSNWTPQLIREINLTKRRRKKRTTMHKKSYFCQEEWESMSQSELC